MTTFRRMEKCFFCGSEFQFSEHIYAGKAFREWDVSLCDYCYNASSDGVGPVHEGLLLHHLAAQGIEPQRNEKGWIVWPR
jgi:hypothetical protein